MADGRSASADGAVKTRLQLAGTKDRIVLFFWSLSKEARYSNVARVDSKGHVLWRAVVPGGAARDCFVSLKRDGSVFVAETFSGLQVRLDADGRQLQLMSSAIAA